MTVRAVALFSGGLDSMLAVRIAQAQGIEVHALNFGTTFVCCADQAAQAAEELGVPLSIVAEQETYLDVVRNPRHGYGRGANPCLDCRIYMFQIAGRYMRDMQADMVISGEVVGQRPMSQKKRDLALIAHHAGLDDRLVRPLSAKLLPQTLPEREGLIDRAQLYGISGRGRGELIALAREFGFKRIPQPSTGCALTEPAFAEKVYDLLGHDPAADRWQFELLKTGRHVRFDRLTKVVLGRRSEENELLARLWERSSQPTTLMVPHDFQGPTALVVGPAPDAALDFAGGLLRRYAKLSDETPAHAMVRYGTTETLRSLMPHPEAVTAASL